MSDVADLDEGVLRLLDAPNFATVSTLNADGTIHSAVVWADVQDGRLAVNSAVGRAWPANLARNPQVTVTVFDRANPYEYVEVRGKATARTEGADAHIDRLPKKYLGVDTYPSRQPGEERISFLVEPERVHHRKG